MGDDYITLRQALDITGHKETSQLRRAAERWATGDKTGLQAVRMTSRLWATKVKWVMRWQELERRKHGRPPGARDTKPRKPRRRPSPQEPDPTEEQL